MAFEVRGYRQFGMRVCLELTLAVSVSMGLGLSGMRWQPENAADLTLTMLERGRSKLECGLRCQSQSPCGTFCYQRSSGSCYLGVESYLSPVQVVGNTSDLACYGKANCPADAGFKAFGGRCLKMYTIGLNYSQATSTCNQHGAHLYHYRSLEFDKVPMTRCIAATAADWLTAPDKTYIWLGGDDTASEGSFVWTDGTDIPLDHTHVGIRGTQRLVNGRRRLFAHWLTVTFKVFAWLGGDDMASEGSFVWTDGTDIALDLPMWEPGEPNDWSPAGEDCVIVEINRHQINDYGCSKLCPFICQIDM